LEVLNSKAVPVDVRSLRIGMYVSALDRPWLETPFLFQGFHIRDAEDIAALRQHCRMVYVDPEESADDIDFSALAGAALPPQRGLPRPAADAGEADERQSVYTDIAELRRELGEARDRHQQAMLLIREVIDNLANGGKLDVDTARKATQPIVDSVLKNRSAMSWLVRLRQEDDYIYTHSVSSAIWATVMARHIGMPKEEIELVGLGAMLLDIGKTRLPKELLAKPGPLTAEEMRHARQHVAFGVKLLEGSGVDPTVMAMVRTHHERHDGSGYPKRLRAEQIPVHGRIAGIVDFYDAVTSDRPYACARSSYDCLRALNRLAGTRFQAEIVEQFIQSIGFFPPGTLVELNDGCVAVVVAQNRRHRLKPEVLLVTGPDKKLLVEFRLLDLQMPVRSDWTDEPLHIDRGLEPGSHGIDPAEFFLG
jgi:putative nucleotidyltransferase with HDIG domain